MDKTYGRSVSKNGSDFDRSSEYDIIYIHQPWATFTKKKIKNVNVTVKNNFNFNLRVDASICESKF